jgi:hypothetical protein
MPKLSHLLSLVLLTLPVKADIVWQPVTNYAISFPGDRPDAAPAINPFDNFTHFGTDFGWMGPGQARIDSRAGIIHTRPDGEWTGTWHSLAGLASEDRHLFDPRDVTDLGGAPERCASVTAVTVDVGGKGKMRLELLDGLNEVRWQQNIELDSTERKTMRFPVNSQDLGPLKFFNWVAEPGCALDIASIGFEVKTPKMSPEEWMFRVSLGKLHRCHDSASGMTRDRAHIAAGRFDSVPATAMHALAMAVAASEGTVERYEAITEVRRSTKVLLGLPRAKGFLPHFTDSLVDDKPRIHPNTEFSTIDTAIAFHSLRLAGDILNLEDVKKAVENAISELDFDAVTNDVGYISHGLADDGKTLLPGIWYDWGGESALVLALEAMVPNRPARGRMSTSGEVFRGCGFIPELQSLFYPDFDSEKNDAVSNVNWAQSRRHLLEQQIAYFPAQWPDSEAAKKGLWGLSAGEAGMPGAGYVANGVILQKMRWIHPHTMIMESAQSGKSRYRQDLASLRAAGQLYPLGLPENIEIDMKVHNPMQGSLNAGFEALASYHGWRRAAGKDVIDQWSRKDPLLRKAMQRFYPNGM